jgi:hypothetical protein
MIGNGICAWLRVTDQLPVLESSSRLCGGWGTGMDGEGEEWCIVLVLIDIIVDGMNNESVCESGNRHSCVV